MNIRLDIPSLPNTLVAPVTDLRDSLLARLQRIVMYGSYARGEAHQDSDIDILVILKNNDSNKQNQARDVRYAVMEKHHYQPLISLLLIGETDWKELSKKSAGLKHNIDKEGITL